MDATDELKALFTKLSDEGATAMEIYYQGGGDSGWIEEIHTDNELQLDNKEISIIEEYAYSLLGNNLEFDWINNEGGYGWLRINLEEAEFDIEGYARTVESDDATGKLFD